jgi:hypothetical protein
MHRALVTLLLLLMAAACADLAGGRADDTLARTTFIDAYVDLRVAALRTPDGEITDSARAAILTRHGITEEALLEFVTETSGDLDFTRDLWNEIELRLDSVPPLPVDSSSALDGGAGEPESP